MNLSSGYYPSRQKSVWPRLLFLVLISAGTWWATSALLNSTSGPIVSPLADEETPPSRSIFAVFQHKKTAEELRQKIKEQVGSRWVNYSIYVKDFSSDFSMGINESVIYTAASVNKVPILAALYYQAQNGKADFDETITIQPEDVQGGTGSIQYDPPGTTYTVRTLAQLMMQKSDNTAANVLAKYVVGIKTIQSLADSWGMTQTDIANNKTSNKDMAILFEKIFKRNVANEALTEEMLAFLKDSDFEERIPGQLPKGATVYHKIGNEVGNIHDVGIVVYDGKAYYIGILTEDVRDEEEAKQLEAKISKLVFDFMQ